MNVMDKYGNHSVFSGFARSVAVAACLMQHGYDSSGSRVRSCAHANAIRAAEDDVCVDNFLKTKHLDRSSYAARYSAICVMKNNMAMQAIRLFGSV